MGLNVYQFRSAVLQPTLKNVGLWSESAEMLLLGTALVESGKMHFLRQLGDGPALGLYQMEPVTHDDIWDNFLSFRKQLRREVLAFLAPIPEPKEQLITNLAYATVMARVHYLRVPAPLPMSFDIRGLANYWKTHYNTHLGKGDPDKFVNALEAVI